MLRMLEDMWCCLFHSKYHHDTPSLYGIRTLCTKCVRFNYFMEL